MGGTVEVVEAAPFTDLYWHLAIKAVARFHVFVPVMRIIASDLARLRILTSAPDHEPRSILRRRFNRLPCIRSCGCAGGKGADAF